MFIIGSIIIITIIVSLGVSWLARGIIFEGINHDSYKQVNAAAHFSDWGGWPSGMHRFGDGKAWMKDVGVLLLVLSQLIFKDKKGFYPLFIVSNFANAVSAILVFLVAQSYWGTNIGFFLFILYFFCFWPFQIVLVGGLQGVAQMLFLLSIYTLQQTEQVLSFSNITLFTVSGFLFGLINFSSASGRKLIPVFISALVYHLSNFKTLPWLFYETDYAAYIGGSVLIGFAVMLMVVLGIVSFFYKKITRLIYEDRFSFLKFLSKDKHDIEYYYCKIRKIVRELTGMIYFICGTIILISVYLSQDESYILLGCVFLGTISVFFLFMAPNFKQNIIGYYLYWTIESDWGSHYNLYNDYFKKEYGKVFKKGKEGWIWYLKFYWRMIPFHTLLYVSTIIYIPLVLIVRPVEELIGFVLLTLISLMPIIWGETTTGPKASLAMYTSFITLFLPVGYSMHISHINEISLVGIDVSAFIWLFLALSSAWNIYIFLTDTLPCRLTVHRIMKTLDKNNIKKFFTYDTLFNSPLTDVIKDFFPDKYDIQYISSINEIKSGYLLVPCTSSKAAYYQSAGKIGPVGDYKADEALNSIIETREIQKFSVASFKTFGNSKYWQQIGNVVSFRDLILKEVNDEDRFRGYAWLLDVKKII